MKDEVNPVMNRELYARAESAALAASEKAKNETPKRRVALMDRAGRKVFKEAGTRRDAADLYAMCITEDIMEREHAAKSRGGRAQRQRSDPF
jgi:hypothetical protein